MARLRVLLPLPLADAYDYRAPAGLPVAAGAFVVVPLGRRQAIGVVWDGSPDPALAESRLRGVEQILDVPPMTATLRRFVDWVAAYTLSPPGAVLRMAMSAPSALEPRAPQAGWRRAAQP
ncbi:MAG TPA: primosomal protein N', partial [Roseomonas sp.]|nr:primosomal protein N' [Roseomonas sp.]